MKPEEYKRLQEEGSGLSYNTKWGDQMERAILEYLGDKPKNSKIIDVGCGEGRGLHALRNIGFTQLVGVDISTPKIKIAKESGLEVYELDFHDMGQFHLQEFDYLFCSHAIEHSLNPTKVLLEARRIAKNGLFIAPIDPTPQPPLGQSPHTHNFATEQEWIDLFVTIFPFSYHQPKTRLGKEVWSQFYED